MLRASIDLGTNTCLLLVASVSDSAQLGQDSLTVVEDLSTIVRLGQGVDRSQVLAPEAMRRTVECLKRYRDVVLGHGMSPEQVVAVTTATARDAKNGVEFFERVKVETGFCFRVLTGQEEAQASFQGALLPGQDPAEVAIIDIGGGSTEILSLRGGMSVNLGAVRFSERYLHSDPVTDQEFWNCQAAVDQELRNFTQWRSNEKAPFSFIAVAGTATTLAAWFLELKEFSAQKIDQVVLTRGDLHRMVEELKWRTVEERRQLPGVEPDRADVLLAGALILWRALEVLDISRVRISTRGLRFGVLYR